MEITLNTAEILCFDDASPIEIVCRQGVLWVTQAGNPRDHVLYPAASFRSRGKGRIAVTACRAACLQIVSPIPPGQTNRIVRLDILPA